MYFRRISLLYRFFCVILCGILSACQKETFSVPPDEVFDPSSTKLRDAVIEFDAMSGFNATDDFTFTPSYNEYEIMVRKHYSSTVTGIGGQVNIIGVADQTNMPQPEQEGFTDLFSNLDSRQLRMLQYAARQRQKNPTNSVLLSYMYHFLSVDSNNYPASLPIGGVILGVSSVQGENVPQDAVNRASFLFVDDLRRWANTNNVSRKELIAYASSHELGHQIRGLTHAPDGRYHHSLDKCIMGYYTASNFQTGLYSSLEFCYYDLTHVSCVYYLHTTKIDTPTVAYSD